MKNLTSNNIFSKVECNEEKPNAYTNANTSPEQNILFDMEKEINLNLDDILKDHDYDTPIQRNTKPKLKSSYVTGNQFINQLNLNRNFYNNQPACSNYFNYGYTLGGNNSSNILGAYSNFLNATLNQNAKFNPTIPSIMYNNYLYNQNQSSTNVSDQLQKSIDILEAKLRDLNSVNVSSPSSTTSSNVNQKRNNDLTLRTNSVFNNNFESVAASTSSLSDYLLFNNNYISNLSSHDRLCQCREMSAAAATAINNVALNQMRTVNELEREALEQYHFTGDNFTKNLDGSSSNDASGKFGNN